MLADLKPQNFFACGGLLGRENTVFGRFRAFITNFLSTLPSKYFCEQKTVRLIRTIVYKNNFALVSEILWGRGLFLSNQNPKIGRRPENLDILSRKMNFKCVFRAFATPQAPKSRCPKFSPAALKPR